MLLVNELRLGNVVALDGKPIIIDAATLIAILSGEGERYEPIPLTEEWISGAKYNELENEYTFPELSQWALDMVYKEIVFNGGYIATSAPVEYVHQLQNFFFIMKGEEMEIHLPQESPCQQH